METHRRERRRRAIVENPTLLASSLFTNPLPTRTIHAAGPIFPPKRPRISRRPCWGSFHGHAEAAKGRAGRSKSRHPFEYPPLPTQHHPTATPPPTATVSVLGAPIKSAGRRAGVPYQKAFEAAHAYIVDTHFCFDAPCVDRNLDELRRFKPMDGLLGTRRRGRRPERREAPVFARSLLRGRR